MRRESHSSTSSGGIAITVGAGRRVPQGKRLPVSENPCVRSVVDALDALPTTADSWWSPHLWEGDYRGGARWLGASLVVLDLDYIDADGEHAAPPAEALASLKAAVASSIANLWHTTPRGARFVTVLERTISEPEEYQAVQRGVVDQTRKLLERMGVPGYRVDDAALDLARVFFAPRARVDGVARVAVSHLLSDRPRAPSEFSPPESGRFDSIDEAVQDYNADHRKDWPKSSGTCPACGHQDCFGTLPTNPNRWTCFSDSHQNDSRECGRQARGCWSGDALDLDAQAASISRIGLLRREGYLGLSGAATKPEPRDPHCWSLGAGEYRIVSWPQARNRSFVKLEFLYQGFATHRDKLDIDSEAARKRFASAVARKLPDLVDDLRERVNQDLWELVSRIESVEPEFEHVESDDVSASAADKLVGLAAETELFHDAQPEAYATVVVGDHKETLPVRSTAFRNWLRANYYKTYEKAASSQALQDAIGTLESNALFSGDLHEVHVRVAEHDGVILLDLGRADWNVIRVDSRGWRVVSDAPVKFVRPKGLYALPVPVTGGSLRELRRFLNISRDRDWILFQAALIAMLHPGRPFVVIVFAGEQGSAKSTAQRVMRRLVDPNKAELRSVPRSEHDLVLAARNAWVVALDNLSRIPDWLSDAICRLATGGGFGTRKLYADTDEELFDALRPVLLNGIEAIATRGDLLDRAIIISLAQIDRRARMPERKFWPAFEQAQPRILGAMLDALSLALRNLPDVELDELPRMADFAIFGVAAEPALDCREGEFISSYMAACESVIKDALDATPLAPVVQEFVAAQGRRWQGTATALFDALNMRAGDRKKQPGWPRSPAALKGQLSRLAPSLRAAGLRVDFTQDVGSGSTKRIALWVENSSAGSDNKDRGDIDGQGEYRERFE